MKEILKLLNLTDDAIKIYLECYNKDFLTLDEIASFIPLIPKDNIKNLIQELINNKLLLKTNPENFKSLEYYRTIPPFSTMSSLIKADVYQDNYNIKEVIKNSISDIFAKENTLEIDTLYDKFQKFKDDIERDSEEIKKEISDLIDDTDKQKSSFAFLSDYENELKNLISSELASIVIILLQMKDDFQSKLKDLGITQNQWQAIKDDIKNILAMGTHKKALELSEIVSEEFAEIKNELVKSTDNSCKSQFEQNSIYLGILNLFKNEIFKMDKIITTKKETFDFDSKKLQHILTERLVNSFSEFFKNITSGFQVVEKTLENLTLRFIKENKSIVEHFWPIKSCLGIKQEISSLLNEANSEIIIIVPEIEGFIPLVKFNLEIKDNGQSSKKKRNMSSEGVKITLSEKMDLKERFESFKKNVNVQKGFEMTHKVAEIMSIVSELNPESIILDNIKDWLNRLLVIRKQLDPNLKIMLLDDVEKWQADYLKSKGKKKKPPSKKKEKTINKEISSEQNIQDVQDFDFLIQIVSSENHKNDLVRAFHGGENIEYRKLKNSNFIGILADNSYLIIGTFQQLEKDPLKQVLGFGTDNKFLINAFLPLLTEKWKLAKPPKQNQITSGFNQIIENINDLKGKKIGKLLANILDIAFKQEGISLNIIEIKLLINQLNKINIPLDDDKKKLVLNKIGELNSQFSSMGLVESPELRPAASKMKTIPKKTMDLNQLGIVSMEEIIDEEKINTLFDLFLEKIDSLKGNQISEQIQHFMNLALKFHGGSDIINWKNELSSINTLLDGPFKDKLKEDFQKWRLAFLSPQKINALVQLEKGIQMEQGQSSIGGSLTEIPSAAVVSTETMKPKDVNFYFDIISNKLDVIPGSEISKNIQNIMDILLETEGYSKPMKDMKFWVGKLKKNNNPLGSKDKREFSIELEKWNDKFKKEEIIEEASINQQENVEVSKEEVGEIKDASSNNELEFVMQNGDTLKGFEIGKKLQEFMDRIIETVGYSMTLKDVKNWVSKLRGVKNPIEGQLKTDFLEAFNKWYAKFS